MRFSGARQRLYGLETGRTRSGRPDRSPLCPSVRSGQIPGPCLFPCRLRSGRSPGRAQFRFQNPNDRERKGNLTSPFPTIPLRRSNLRQGGVKIVGQPLRLLCDCRRRSPERLRFRSKRDYCLGAFGTINGTKASASVSPCGARSGSSQRDTVTFIRYFPGFTPSSGTRTVAVSRGGMSATQIPSATTRFAPATIW